MEKKRHGKVVERRKSWVSGGEEDWDGQTAGKEILDFRKS